MTSRMPEDYYGYSNLSESPYDATIAPSGLPSFGHSAEILPQYSHVGRIEPEFIYSPAQGYADEEDDRPAIALGNTTKILGYEPREGTGHTPIVIRLLFRRGYIHPKTRVCLRVKMGNIPICTRIEGVQSVNGVRGEWRLLLDAPDPRELDVVGLEVPLIVQTLNVQNYAIIDDVCIGTFKFWDLTPAEESGSGHFYPLSQGGNANNHSALHLHYSSSGSSGDESSSSQMEEESFSVSYQENIPTSTVGLISMSEPAPDDLAQKRSQLIIGVPSSDAVGVSNNDVDTETPSTAKSFLEKKPGEDNYQVSLRFLADMNSMTDNWTLEELNNQRRIVEFFSVRTRGRIDVTFAPISVEKARDTRKNIVSCIWWKDMEEFIITSVDAINLLERLVGTKFTTEEKNRIRRNLQGFKPATVSKSQPESEPFFRTLMEFPPPRPRNIEKDVKAFVWSKLPSMLEKVISKYWFVSSPSESEADESSPKIRVSRDVDGTSMESPSTSFQSLPASRTPINAPPAQMEAESRADALEPRSYMPTPSPSQNRHEEYHSGLSAHKHHLGYPHSSQGSASSTYGHHDALMDICETSMQELHSTPLAMGGSQVLSSGYEHMETYAEGMGGSNPQGTYVHHPSGDMRNNVQYMAHTSHDYA
ncbi:hypothetical protein ACGC1H_007096 [Rhizoctonia solani]|uniref:DUF7082 domain-containing protein n=1 Tax=Rhizoctonia solani TaxID=456999 RepID=A0A8H2X740_9AGAM|nr:unnamed protein product [Rhizoctonia solani]